MIDFGYLFRKYSASLRMLPTYLIVGAQKAGTTSLDYYLSQHPKIKTSPRKEVNYFNLNAKRPLSEYRMYFPFKFSKFIVPDLHAGEATPDYLIYPQVPELIKSVLPEVKIIILLRNPADRAYSHYEHNLMMKREWLSFEEALEIEDKRIGKNFVDIFSSKNDMIKNYSNYCYRTRGIYVEQLENYYKHFPAHQILIIQSELLFSKPLTITNDCLNFLNLPQLERLNAEPKNQKQVKVEKKWQTYESLKSFYKPHNERLFKLIGKKFDW